MQDGTELWQADVEKAYDAVFSMDGMDLYVGGTTLSVWSVETGERAKTVSELQTGMLAITENGRFIAAPQATNWDTEPSVAIWETSTWRCVRRIKGVQSPALSLAFSNSGVESPLFLFAGTRDGVVMVVNVASGKIYMQRVVPDGKMCSIVVDPDNDLVFTAERNNNDYLEHVRQWSLSAWIERVK